MWSKLLSLEFPVTEFMVESQVLSALKRSGAFRAQTRRIGAKASFFQLLAEAFSFAHFVWSRYVFTLYLRYPFFRQASPLTLCARLGLGRWRGLGNWPLKWSVGSFFMP